MLEEVVLKVARIMVAPRSEVFAEASVFILEVVGRVPGGERQDAAVLAEARAVGWLYNGCQNSAGWGDIQRINPPLKHMVPTAYDGTAQPIAVQE